LDYERIARSFFAISLERDGVILYSRCNFSAGARAAIHCFDLTYPQEEKRSWDAVVTRIEYNLQYLLAGALALETPQDRPFSYVFLPALLPKFTKNFEN
jgi:hypothetical protein